MDSVQEQNENNQIHIEILWIQGSYPLNYNTVTRRTRRKGTEVDVKKRKKAGRKRWKIEAERGWRKKRRKRKKERNGRKENLALSTHTKFWKLPWECFKTDATLVFQMNKLRHIFATLHAIHGKVLKVTIVKIRSFLTKVLKVKFLFSLTAL